MFLEIASVFMPASRNRKYQMQQGKQMGNGRKICREAYKREEKTPRKMEAVSRKILEISRRAQAHRQRAAAMGTVSRKIRRTAGKAWM